MRTRIFAITALLAFTAGCGGSLYKVKAPATDALPSDAKATTAGELAFKALPLMTDEESQDLFEANLPMSGILPVGVEAVNSGSATIELNKAKFRLRDGIGHEWKFRTAKQTAQHIMDFEQVYLYNPSARKEFFAAMQKQSFDTKSPLGPGERRSGILFFRSPGKEQVYHPGGLVLTVDKLPQPVEIALN